MPRCTPLSCRMPPLTIAQRCPTRCAPLPRAWASMTRRKAYGIWPSGSERPHRCGRSGCRPTGSSMQRGWRRRTPTTTRGRSSMLASASCSTMPITADAPPRENDMREFTEETLTEAVVARLARCEDPRFRQVMTTLIRHLHSFVRDVELTEAEWTEAIHFLTATGQKCVGDRQEFILLSDVLGVSMLVDAINHRKPDGATESTVLGPFYAEGAPELPHGSDIAHGGPGEPTEVSGRVLTPDGRPIKGAILDVWQTAANALYSTQDPKQDRFNMRGRFRTDDAGAFHFRTVKPVSYPVPTDGPVGTILNAMGRHPMRPAHIH